MINNGYDVNYGYEAPVRPARVVRKRRNRKGSAGKVIALAVCCSVIGGVFGAGSMFMYSRIAGQSDMSTNVLMSSSAKDTEILKGQRDTTAVNVSYVNTSAVMTASQIYQANVNSTVGIKTSVTTNYFGYKTTAAASGSGFILTADGYIITNYHVVEDGKDITVTTYDNKSYKAELVGFDESNDIAVLKVEASGLTPVVLGDSDQMNVGDDVVAIGNPLGELTFSLTSGVVSALNRKITINNVAMNLIQTDCAINSGNSGGALFNSHGEVIGITNAKYSSSGSTTEASVDNVGFAIPINSVINIVNSIIESGTITKPYIGVSMYDLGNRYQIKGVVVREIESDSPADKAGLEENDIITKADGKDITSVSEFKNILADHNEGDSMTLTVYRDGELADISVTVTVREQSALPEAKEEQAASRGYRSFPG